MKKISGLINYGSGFTEIYDMFDYVRKRVSVPEPYNERGQEGLFSSMCAYGNAYWFSDGFRIVLIGT